jgi:hypothetical protein
MNIDLIMKHYVHDNSLHDALYLLVYGMNT